MDKVFTQTLHSMYTHSHSFGAPIELLTNMQRREPYVENLSYRRQQEKTCTYIDGCCIIPCYHTGIIVLDGHRVGSYNHVEFVHLRIEEC